MKIHKLNYILDVSLKDLSVNMYHGRSIFIRNYKNLLYGIIPRVNTTMESNCFGFIKCKPKVDLVKNWKIVGKYLMSLKPLTVKEI